MLTWKRLMQHQWLMTMGFKLSRGAEVVGNAMDRLPSRYYYSVILSSHHSNTTSQRYILLPRSSYHVCCGIVFFLSAEQMTSWSSPTDGFIKRSPSTTRYSLGSDVISHYPINQYLYYSLFIFANTSLYQ